MGGCAPMVHGLGDGGVHRLDALGLGLGAWARGVEGSSSPRRPGEWGREAHEAGGVSQMGLFPLVPTFIHWPDPLRSYSTVGRCRGRGGAGSQVG